MADKMVFPIGFDLEAAVKGAGEDWEKKYAKRLEDLIAKRPINVKLKLDTSKLDSLDAVKKRLAELKIEPITPETKTAIKELARELNQLARAMEAVSKYTISRGMASPDAVRAARISEIDAKRNVALERQRKLQADVRIKEERLALAREKAARAAERGATATRNANREYQSQDGYISRLLKRMAVYAGYSAIGTFLTNVREVTAQFELQRVSLGAIIQDQARANQLFSEIKTFALKSPISIMDLTKYTKQVAAYGIETEKLFGTTKMLADISVGLGVSLDRLALFYGQVYATGYLRASEVRQATEAGIPLVEKLAEKISQANGELVSAAQVMDMISKRAVSFELVEEVFQDMTSAGGMFYNMQEKQGETLAGMWAKLGDAASMMYDQIGNTSVVNNAMKTTIGLLTDFMRNWKGVVGTIGGLGIGLALTKGLNIYKRQLAGIEATRVAASRRMAVAQETLNAVVRKGAVDNEVYAATGRKVYTTEFIRAKAASDVARAELMAANATTVWGKAWNKLKAAFMGNWVGLLLTAVAAIVTHFLMAEDAAARLKNTLADLNAESERETAESVGKFKILADRAVEAADGSKTQKDALDELKNTYGQIIPYEYLTIENLRKMKGEYGELTTMIEEYNAKLKLTNAQNAITEEYAPKEKDRRTKLRKLLTEDGIKEKSGAVVLYDVKFNPVTTQKFFNELDEISKKTTDKSKVIRQAVAAIWNDLDLGPMTVKLQDGTVKTSMYYESVVKAMENLDRHELEGQGTMMDYVKALIEKNQLLQQEQDNYDKAAASLNEYSAIVDGLQKKIQDKSTNKFTDDESYSTYLKNEKSKLQDVYNAIRDVVQKEGQEIILANNELVKQFSEGSITYADFLDKLLELPLSAKAHAAVEAIQKVYTQLAPTDQTVVVYRDKFSSLANTMEISMFRVQKSQMKQGQTLKEHRKVIADEIDAINEKILQFVATKGLMTQQGYDTTDIEKQLETEKKLLEFYKTYLGSIPNFDKKKTKSGSKSDPRLQTLQEIANKMAEVNKEYDELLKKEGQTKALTDTQKLFAESFKQMQSVANKYKFKLPAFEVPKTIEDVQKWYDAIIDNIKRLNLKNADKVLIELGFKRDKAAIDKQQKDIEAELKRLSDKISRTKTAKEFYDKILSQTGNVEMAGTLTMNIYGDNGEVLFYNTFKQIQRYFSGVEVDLPINFDTEQIDYKALREIWEADKALPKDMRKIPEAYDSAIKQMLDSADSSNQKMIEGWLKATEKAKTYSDKLLDLARTTQTEINKITLKKGEAETRITELLGLGDLDADQQKELDSLRNFLAIADNLIQGFKDKQAKEQTSLAYEAFKDSPMYVQMFDDLDNASTRMLENMKTRMEGLKSEWKNLTPAQIKELQSRMNEIDNQLARRNPFKTLRNAIKKYRDYMKNGEGDGKTKSAKEAENLLTTTAEAADEAQKKYDELIKKYGEGSEKSVKEVIDAKNDLDIAMANEEAAQKSVENWKKVKDAIGLSANELFQMLNWAGDIARGIADISEAMGADEEDVQYWNDIADALGEISGGIQDIISAAMSGNVVGVISSIITAIPKMFVGFANLFSAGKIKKANKEIKRQQELLDQLEYTYGRLQKAAEKLFGADYINNYNQQLRNLEAQQLAYEKQLQAEKSKGKKADEEKIKEYEEKIRDVKDELADMQGKLAEKMLGTDLASSARDFAKAWIDAYKEVGRAGAETSKAMKEKFQDMVENMVVEGALAAVMQKALQPMFDMIDNMSEQDFYKESFWKKVAETAAQGAEDADKGAQTLMKFLEQAGISIKDINAEYTGIKRDIAGASEETMSNVATIGNTLMYYVSPIPGIAANVALLTQHILNGNASATTATTAAGWTDWQQQAMDQYMAIQRNTADTAVECRRAAQAAENAVAALNRVITTRGAKHGFQVYM